MNTHVPEEYGGPGASYLDGCLIEEELVLGLLRHRDLDRRQRPRLGAARARRLRGAQEASTSGCSPRTSSSPPSA